MTWFSQTSASSQVQVYKKSGTSLSVDGIKKREISESSLVALIIEIDQTGPNTAHLRHGPVKGF